MLGAEEAEMTDPASACVIVGRDLDNLGFD